MRRDSARQIVPTGWVETDSALEMFTKLLVHLTKLQFFPYPFAYLFGNLFIFPFGRESLCSPNPKDMVFVFDGWHKKHDAGSKCLLVTDGHGLPVSLQQFYLFFCLSSPSDFLKMFSYLLSTLESIF